MRRRSRCSTCSARSALALLLVAVVLGLAYGGAALAQEERSFVDKNKVQNPARKAAQARFIGDLQTFAATKAAPGSAEYWAIIQANFAKGRHDILEKGERSLSTLPSGFHVPVPGERAPLDEKSMKALADYIEKLKNGERIFGGEPARKNEFVEVVSLARHDGAAFSSFCTGTLIGEGTVLTAGHCVCGQEFAQEPRAAVVFGTDVSNAQNGIVVAFSSDSFETMQPDYCALYNDKGARREARRDIAIVRFNPSEPPLAGRMPAGGLRFSRVATWQFMFGQELEELQLVGFGWTEDDRIGQKRFTSTRVAESVCRPASRYGCIEGNEIVAIDALAKRDTCQGDSGGPAFIAVGRESYLAAVTSRGAECGTGGIYSLITPRVMQWLRSEMRVDLVTCESPTRCVQRVR